MKHILVRMPHYDRRNLLPDLPDLPPAVPFSTTKRASELPRNAPKPGTRSVISVRPFLIFPASFPQTAACSACFYVAAP